MLRLATLFALLISWQVVLGPSSAQAADGETSSDLPGEVRGMIVLKLPFGGPRNSSAPRLGFDPQTGRRLPGIDASRARTWQLDPPEFLLPDDEQGRPDPIEPRGGRPELS